MSKQPKTTFVKASDLQVGQVMVSKDGLIQWTVMGLEKSHIHGGIKIRTRPNNWGGWNRPDAPVKVVADE